MNACPVKLIEMLEYLIDSFGVPAKFISIGGPGRRDSKRVFLLAMVRCIPEQVHRTIASLFNPAELNRLLEDQRKCRSLKRDAGIFDCPGTYDPPPIDLGRCMLTEPQDNNAIGQATASNTVVKGGGVGWVQT